MRRAPGPVLAPRPGTRARGVRRHRGPRRAREAQARKNEPTELRRSGRSMPDNRQPSTPQTGRRAHEAHEAHRCEALPGRENTTGDRRALVRYEQGGRASAPLQATGNCPGDPRRPQRQKRSTTNARWNPVLRVRPREFQESGSSLCSSRKPTRARGAERGARSLTITYQHAG